MDLFKQDELQVSPQPQIEDKDYVQELVGEGKKFKDVQALARGKAESDAYIASLKTRLEEVEKDRQGRMNMEDFLNQIKSTKEEPRAAALTTPQVEAPKGITEEDVRRLLDTEYSKKEQIRIEAENFRQVQKELIDKFGQNYQSEVKRKADSLGLGQEFLNSLARQNPKAFIALVGTDTRTPVENLTPPKNIFGTESFSVTTGKTYKDFQELRRKDPHRYQSPEVQAEMHRLAIADPIGFGLKP